MTTEFNLPELGENITSGTVAKILVSKGDTIEANQNVLEIETDKAVAEIPCPFAGKVFEIRAAEGEKINVGDVVFLLEETDAPVKKDTDTAKEDVSVKKKEPAPENSTAPTTAAQEKKKGGKVRAAPSVRKLAREHDLSLEEIPYSDPGGKITANDVLAYVAAADEEQEEKPGSETNDASPASGETAYDRSTDKWGEVFVEPMSAIRRKAATHLSECWTTIPHVTHFDRANITELEAFRQRYSQKAEKSGAKLTITAFLIKLLPEVFKQFPRFNATVDMEQEQFLLKQYCNIGVAVDTPKGLVVPVMRDVNTKSVMDISAEMSHLAAKARDRKLPLDALQGGGFTVSNLGGLGGYAFTPIINAPETAILGISRSAIEPVYIEHEFQPRLMLPLSLSYDHRCIDGADAARFMRFLCESLEQPWRLTLGL